MKKHVRILSTARKVNKTDIEFFKKLLTSNGFEVSYGLHLFKEDNQFAGNSTERAEDLQNAIDDQNVDIILCAAGGYGTSKIIDQVDFKGLNKKEKLVCGFSDITALHFSLVKYGVVSLHSTMPVMSKFEANRESENGLIKYLKNELNELVFEPHSYNKAGIVEGKIIGGNLSIVNHIIGTSSDFNFDGFILLLEDLDEYLYNIDRLMTQLKRANKLKNLSGLIVGHFSDMNDNKVPFGKDSYTIIRDIVQEYDFPVAYNAPVGHSFPNLPLPLGQNCKLSINERNSHILFDV